MVNIIVEISKYLLLYIMIMFTWGVYRALSARDKETRTKRQRNQLVWMIVFNFVAYFTLYIQTMNIAMIILYAAVVVYIILTQVLYNIFYIIYRYNIEFHALRRLPSRQPPGFSYGGGSG